MHDNPPHQSGLLVYSTPVGYHPRPPGVSTAPRLGYPGPQGLHTNWPAPKIGRRAARSLPPTGERLPHSGASAPCPLPLWRAASPAGRCARKPPTQTANWPPGSARHRGGLQPPGDAAPGARRALGTDPPARQSSCHRRAASPPGHPPPSAHAVSGTTTTPALPGSQGSGRAPTAAARHAHTHAHAPVRASTTPTPRRAWAPARVVTPGGTTPPPRSPYAHAAGRPRPPKAPTPGMGRVPARRPSAPFPTYSPYPIGRDLHVR